MAVTAIIASAFSCRALCCRKRQIQATVCYNADVVAVVAVGQPVTVRHGLQPGDIVGPFLLGRTGEVVVPGPVSNCPPPRYEEIIVGIDG